MRTLVAIDMDGNIVDCSIMMEKSNSNADKSSTKLVELNEDQNLRLINTIRYFCNEEQQNETFRKDTITMIMNKIDPKYSRNGSPFPYPIWNSNPPSIKQKDEIDGDKNLCQFDTDNIICGRIIEEGMVYCAYHRDIIIQKYRNRRNRKRLTRSYGSFDQLEDVDYQSLLNKKHAYDDEDP